jgi:cysteine desulfuration protein SufE
MNPHQPLASPPTQLQIKEADLIRDLLYIEDAQERMGVLLDRAKRSPAFPPEAKVEENRVKGCVSHVWVCLSIEEGKCRVRFEAESPMVKALVGLVCRLFDRADPAEIPGFEPVLLEKLGLTRELSPTRLNGLYAVIARIKALAANS